MKRVLGMLMAMVMVMMLASMVEASASTDKADITTIEMDEETCAYFACTYRISAGE